MAELIAVVEDEQNIRDNVAFALEREGYRVETHADGAAAWEAFQQELPELVILDIIMPRMDGLELCRRLRTVSENIPIIFLTSRDEEFDRVLGLELGADDSANRSRCGSCWPGSRCSFGGSRWDVKRGRDPMKNCCESETSNWTSAAIPPDGLRGPSR